MLKKSALAAVLLLTAVPLFARDFIVEFQAEHYKEEQVAFSYLPVIYHAIQVSSAAGPKLLVLKGDDYHYRRWLRQYIARDKAFIVKVPDDQSDRFVTSHTFDIDVNNIHPLDLEAYKKGEQESRRLQMEEGPPPEKRMDRASGTESLRPPPRRPASKDRQDRARRDRPDSAQQQKKAAADLKSRAEQERLKEQAEAREKAQQKAALEKQKQSEELLKALEAQKAEAERQAREQEALYKALAEERAKEEALRRQELEQRWQALKQRLLQDERIRNLEIDERNREIQQRWLELKYSLGL